VCSFLLINFWFTRFQANKAAIKAMVVNRVGDAALTVAIFISIYFFGSVSFNEFLGISELVIGPALVFGSFF
jgi:NADH-ubiquinone oxidoreductase chain 5